MESDALVQQTKDTEDAVDVSAEPLPPTQQALLQPQSPQQTQTHIDDVLAQQTESLTTAAIATNDHDQATTPLNHSNDDSTLTPGDQAHPTTVTAVLMSVGAIHVHHPLEFGIHQTPYATTTAQPIQDPTTSLPSKPHKKSRSSSRSPALYSQQQQQQQQQSLAPLTLPPAATTESVTVPPSPKQKQTGSMMESLESNRKNARRSGSFSEFSSDSSPRATFNLATPSINATSPLQLPSAPQTQPTNEQQQQQQQQQQQPFPQQDDADFHQFQQQQQADGDQQDDQQPLHMQPLLPVRHPVHVQRQILHQQHQQHFQRQLQQQHIDADDDFDEQQQTQRENHTTTTTAALSSATSLADTLLSEIGTVFMKAASTVVNVLTEPDDGDMMPLFNSQPHSPWSEGRLVVGQCPEGFVRYQCGRSDTFAGIAMRFNMKLNELNKINKLTTSSPFSGQEILVRCPPHHKPHQSTGHSPHSGTSPTNNNSNNNNNNNNNNTTTTTTNNNNNNNNNNNTTNNNNNNNNAYLLASSTTPDIASPAISPTHSNTNVIPTSPNSTNINSNSSNTNDRPKWTYDVLRAPAKHYMKGGKVSGYITLSSSLLVFDADAHDSYLQSRGIEPFQLHLPVSSFIKNTISEVHRLQLESVSVSRVSHHRPRSASLPHVSLPNSWVENTERYEFEILGENAEELVVRLHTRIHVLMVWYNHGKVPESSHPMCQASMSTTQLPTPRSSSSSRSHSRSSSRSASRSPSPEREVNMPVLDASSDLITEHDIRKLVRALPVSHQFSDWFLLYSLQRHGASLGTFQRNTAFKGPNLVIVRDQNGYVFGGFASDAWEISTKYYGTGESFLFQLRPLFRLYPWSKKNEYFMMSTHENICMGGGGHYGFSLDNELLQGSSDQCDTFDSPCLASGSEFQCMHLEVWGFQKPNHLHQITP